ncbi:MAG: hypothetical protein EOP88_12970 [Verrucomicrobiaceae bacterium]|nr:MAG: hypothetical protein EOP88_12970 [Verrucomicrobiaceae bacterium]
MKTALRLDLSGMKRIPHALACALAAGIWVAGYSLLFHEGQAAHYRLWYYTPAAMAAGAVLADRMKAGRSWNGRQRIIDGIVTILCLSRPLWGWPPASGHAIFAIHALLTGSPRCTRILAVLLAALTLYAKLWLWHGDSTLWPGLMLGVISGTLWRKSGGKNPG